MNSMDELRPSLSVGADGKIVSIGSSVIPIINKLQDIFASTGGDLLKVELPQVAVVGSQSSGKSSVLEALVGRDFLPRGSGICTRRPLILQLEKRPRQLDRDDQREWGEFLLLPGKRFYDFSKIRQEIQAETDKEAGINRGVSVKPIRLKISSTNVLNITLVDLPGITKVPVGDQPSDIEARIRTMIMSFISQEACIILAVSPANCDLATSDALQMARAADPSGYRTIGVITKLDIMDRGTNARNFLLGGVIPLRLGYIGVVNRSQEDINKNRSIAEALEHEEQFFRDHTAYHGLSDFCGIRQLAKKLNQVLEQHIKTILPHLKAELNSHLLDVDKELHSYGEIMESKAEQGAILLNILTKYSEALSTMVDGKSKQLSTKALSGGARIHYIFQSIFVKRLEEVDPCDDLTDDDIRTAIQNATGPKDMIFVPELPIEVLVRRQIERLLDPSLQCIRHVHEELIKVSRACEANDEMQRFPVLKRRVDEVVGKFLGDAVKPAEEMFSKIIEIEMGYISTSHPSFLGGSKAIETAMEELRTLKGIHPQTNSAKPTAFGVGFPTSTWVMPSLFGGRGSSSKSQANGSVNETFSDMDQKPSVIKLSEPPCILRPPEMQTDTEAAQIRVTKLLVRSYYDIVRKNIQDFVPKAIMYFLVNHTKMNILSTLIKQLYRENLFDEMLQEQDEVVIKRKQTREMSQILQQAIQALDAVEYDMSSQTSSS